MAKSGPLLTKTVVEKHAKAAQEAKASDPYSQQLTRGYQTQGQSPQVRLLAAYQTLRAALVSSTTGSPETFRQAQKAVRADQQARNPDKKPTSISVKQIDNRIAQLQQTVVQQNAQQAASGTVYSAKDSSQDKANKQQPHQSQTPPEIAQQTISLETTEDTEDSEPVVKSVETQPDQDAAATENKPSLPPTAPEPIRVNYTAETTRGDSPSSINIQPLPQGPSGLKQQVEMIRTFSQTQSGQGPGSLLNQVWRLASSSESIISGASGGSLGPGTMLPGSSVAAGAAPAGGMPGGAAAQGAKGLASQIPKLAAALKAGALGVSLGTIGWIVLGVIVVLIILLLLSSTSSPNMIPTTEFLPLDTGGGQANPNALYGDAIPINVENPCWPVGGEITQLPNLNHGTRCGNKGVGVAYHQAIDIATSTGTRVYAPYAGNVCVKTQTAMGSDGKLEGYGVYLVICTDLGFDMVFAHLADYASGIKQGDQVTKGQLIAFSGDTGNSTGPHLHFEITNLAVCRPYNILDIVPSIPASNQVVESCSQYLGSELQYEPI